jgi:uncharacterized protein with PQ loop repeat
MQLEDVTLALFAACNFIRLFAYLPQIYKAATDKNGASAISYTTWSLFLIAHLSTIAYALVNRSDWWLAACFACNALCCVAILAVAYWKRLSHARAPHAPTSLPLRRHRRLPKSMNEFVLLILGRSRKPHTHAQGARDAAAISRATQSPDSGDLSAAGWRLVRRV